jgi:short-subunit dehydrogenase
MSTLLVLGATSGIARAVALRFTRGGWNLILAGRQPEQLERLARDLKIRAGCHAQMATFDVLDYASHARFWEGLTPPPDAVFCAVGLLGDQAEAERQFEQARAIIDTNFLGVVSILNIAARAFEEVGHGSIMAVSSVAGDRGRRSNYFYGSAKAGLTAYLSGLRSRLHSSNIHVMTIKPGPVRTAMTEGMALPPFLTANPEDVADDVWKAFQRKRDIIYTRWPWRLVMGAIVSLPEWMFKRVGL